MAPAGITLDAGRILIANENAPNDELDPLMAPLPASIASAIAAVRPASRTT